MKFNLKEIKQAYYKHHASWESLEAELLKTRSAEQVVIGHPRIRKFKRLFRAGDSIAYVEIDTVTDQAYKIKVDGSREKAADSLESCLLAVEKGVWEEITENA